MKTQAAHSRSPAPTRLPLLLATLLMAAIPSFAVAEEALDSYPDWASCLRAAAERSELHSGPVVWNAYASDKKKGTSNYSVESSVTAFEGGYRLSSRSVQEESSLETDRFLSLRSKSQHFKDREWQERLGWERQETTWTGEVLDWKQYKGSLIAKKGSTKPSRNSLDMALLTLALELLVNAGRQKSIETSLPMGSMEVGVRFHFHETSSPAARTPAYRFPSGFEPPEGIHGCLVEMELTGAASLLYRHRQYFFYAPLARSLEAAEDGKLGEHRVLLASWGGDPSWPSFQKRASP